jgi:hypothetical protein
LLYWLFFAGSLDAPEVEPLPALPVPALEPLPAVSLELELEEDGEDGAGVDGDGEDGEDGVALRLELDEPDGEDGDDMPPDALPEVLPEPDVRSAPRSQAAIRLAPSATDTATAKV